MTILNNINYIAFDKNRYENEQLFWNTIKEQIKILLHGGYVVFLEYEDCDIYRLEYYYKDRKLGDYYPIPLLPEEEEIIENYRQKSKENNDK